MTLQDIQDMLQSGEGYKLEFKRNVNSDLAKEMVAFANASGGTIVIGINDDNTINGTDTTNEARSRIQTIARDCDPSVDITQEVIGNVVIIHIPEGKDKPYRCTTGFYLRSGANSEKMDRNEIIRFIKAEGKVLFDELEESRAAFPSGLDQEMVEQYRQLAGISSSTGTAHLLPNLGVVVPTANGLVLNNTGVLFFGQDPASLIPQSVVVCVAYKGATKVNILDKKEFGFNLIRNIDEAMAFLKRHLNVKYEITKKRRIEKLEIPEVVLREAVVNAVAHRNYFEKGASVMIEIFDNRVEISNPGGLPKGLRPEDFGKRTLARNPLITGLLNRAGYIEKLGTGVPRIRQAMAEAELPEPEFDFNDFFTIILRRYNIKAEIRKELKLNEYKAARVALILQRLNDNAFNVEEVALETVSTSRTIRNDMDFLAKKGWITSSGTTKGRQYEISALGKEKLVAWS